MKLEDVLQTLRDGGKISHPSLAPHLVSEGAVPEIFKLEDTFVLKVGKSVQTFNMHHLSIESLLDDGWNIV